MRELSTADVGHFLPQPPQTVRAFEAFIAFQRRARAAGRGLCFVVTSAIGTEAIGLIQLAAVNGRPWNWGFVFGSRTWGTGLFAEAADFVLRFAFDVAEIDELEAWCPVVNRRAHGALRKLGAAPELRRDAQAPDGRRGFFLMAY